MSNERESIHMSDPCRPGEVLRDWINGHGKTIREAATLMGVSRATLNRLLSGAGRVSGRSWPCNSNAWDGAAQRGGYGCNRAHDLAAARRAKPVA